ncbi:MAG: BON domain-containing protein [Alphaproteobacteria bacterium]|nr:BON domain-containing protein [Alphaproteobacteria bacterium]MCZ6587070.1 BON domain-containing protein [Alphaproteobacteria bacterium]
MESVLTMPPNLIAEDRPERWRLRRYLIYLVSALALAGCAPTVLSLAVDGAYTASEERTLDDVVDDNGIKLELNKLLLEDGLGLFKDVGTVVYRRHVYLLGDVENAEDKARAGAIGRKPEKVSGVTNDIQVTDEGGIISLVDDIYIEKVIQADYLFDSAIDSSNFRVRSVNGVVYLMGLAESQSELDKAVAIVDARDDVRRIVNYVKVQQGG